MVEELMEFLELQLKDGGHEADIQNSALTIIASDSFQAFTEDMQDIIYQLDMNDLNALTQEDYGEALEQLKKLH